MPKKVVIEVSLVEEADEVPNEEVEGKIFEYLAEYPPKLPWLKEVEKVTVKSS